MSQLQGVREMVNGFLGDERRSKPLGFYSWTPELAAIFRQDRFLQTGMDADTASAIRRALDRNPRCRDTHDTYRRLIARLTNPPAGPSIRPVPAVPDGPDRPGEPGRAALFPASRSHEQEIVEHLYGNRPIPPAFDLLGELTAPRPRRRIEFAADLLFRLVRLSNVVAGTIDRAPAHARKPAPRAHRLLPRPHGRDVPCRNGPGARGDAREATFSWEEQADARDRRGRRSWSDRA